MNVQYLTGYILGQWMIVKCDRYHDSTEAYHNSEYYHTSTECH